MAELSHLIGIQLKYNNLNLKTKTSAVHKIFNGERNSAF